MAYQWLGSFCLPTPIITTDSSTIALLSLPVSNDRHVAVNAIVNGMNNTGVDAISGFLRFAVFRPNSQTIGLMGSPIIEILKNRSSLHASISCSVDTSNNLALITVQGIASETWNWMASYTYLYCNQ